MHQLFHIGILLATLLGAGGLVLLLLWPVFADGPLPQRTRFVLFFLIGLGAVLLLVEWRLVH